MKTLATGDDLRSIQRRLGSLSMEDQPRWGRMSVHQMVCHLCGSMRLPLGEIEISDAEVPELQRRVVKWAALYVPLKWRPNFPTRPELDQCRLNPRLGHFESDRQTAIALTERLCEADLKGKRHPYFGVITQTEWLRWGWLHADHHLRQFGR
jgi:hypothetical protein